MMKSLCIFCGSSPGNLQSYRDAAVATGRLLAVRNIELIYGGGKVGLMGLVADAVLDNGGSVTGIMPKHLVEREIAHHGLTTLIVVDDMQTRKSEMSERSDGFITLPGGAGTLEEIAEQWTWAQLGIHAKPCAFLNVDGYYDPLRQMIFKMADAGFMKREYAEMLVFETEPEAILDAFETYAAPEQKWL